jgi:6-phosphogluconate dehydrogenase
MKLGMVGLGKMGSQMAARLMKGDHECIVFDVNRESMKALELKDAIPSATLSELVSKLEKPRIIWVMVPAGEATESTIASLSLLLDEDDIIIDGGNSYYKDDVRRCQELKKKGINFVDVGTSGGVWGNKNGYCLMVGAEKEIYLSLVPLFRTLAPGNGDIPKTPLSSQFDSNAEDGFLHCGTVGSGHFVKMIHNGIEYGIMESFAEGFDILKNANSKDLPEEHRFDLNLVNISEVWRRGSVVSSWLLDLIAIALAENPTLSDFTGYVHDSGEGRWTIQAALEEAVPAEVLSAALFTRFRSRQTHTFADKMLSAMRKQFGGHIEDSQHTTSPDV